MRSRPHGGTFNCHCLILASIAFRLLVATSANSLLATPTYPITSQQIPTATSQHSHLLTVPTSYFLLAHHHSTPKSCSILCTALLLFLSGYIEPNPGPTNSFVTTYTLNIRSLFHLNRSTHIHEIVSAHNPDIFALTETFHHLESTTPAQLVEATPPGYQLFSVPRQHHNISKHPSKQLPVSGGGVAFLCKDHLVPEQFCLPQYTSFEAISITVASLPCRLTIFNIYRPPDSSNYSQPFSVFIDELTSFLHFAATVSNYIITGDFNIHCNNLTDPHTAQFLSTLSDFNLTQHVTFPTHTSGNILDLLITPENTSTPPMVSCLPSTPSDHFALLSILDIPIPLPRPQVSHSFRRIKSINIPDFISDLSSSDLILSPPPSLEDLVNLYNTTITHILDKHAPLITKVTHSPKLNHWFTPALKVLKKTRRKLEHKWKSLPSLSNLAAFRKANNTYHNAIVAAKKLYHSHLIADNISNPRQLWKTINNLLHRSAITSLPNLSSVTSIAQQFANFFSEKVTKLRTSIQAVNQSPHSPQPPKSPPKLTELRPTDIDEVTKLVMQSPTKQCELDPIPTSLLKQSISILAPTITNIVNLSLSSGTFPSSFKLSIVTPLLKKPTLDKNNLSSYRPISNLSFLSKLTERVVKNRLSEHLSKNSLFNTFQSAYIPFHSTESVLLSLYDCIIRAISKQQVTCLCLLDLSAAFDTIDHSILIHRLSSWFGIENTALSWFQSYLSSRSFTAACGNTKSNSNLVTCGVPQGSVLGPLLFSLYTTPLSSILSATCVSHHLYADDTQLYISFLPSQFLSSIQHLQSAISQVSVWMSANLLSLNPTKTEFLIFGNPYQLSKLNNPTLEINPSTVIEPTPSARNLGFLLDSNLTLNDQISATCKSCNWHIHDLWRIRSTLDYSTAKTIATALVHSKLDYCNSLYLNLPAYQLSRLQHIQNSLARVVCLVPKHHHITPHLHSLHWLKIPQRIDYKLCSITYSLLQHHQPSYLFNLINIRPPRSTRSSSLITLRRPPVLKAKISDRSFSQFIPRLWETLPPALRLPAVSHTTTPPHQLLAISRTNFLSKLKTHLFSQSYPP